MKLYQSGRAPNPRRVRMFLAEKGVTIPIEEIDLAAEEHKSAEFTALNPLQRVPVLVLDDGTAIAESMAICRYFERLRPEPPLFGRGAKEEALVDAVQSRGRVDHDTALHRLERAGAVLTTAETAVFEWTGTAGHPRFKEISQLVKDKMK